MHGSFIFGMGGGSKKPKPSRFRLCFMEPATRFELATYALRMRRSTS